MRSTTAGRTAAPRSEREIALERLIYVAAIIGPFTALPQIYAIWFVDTSAVGVSFTTWALFMVMSAVWLAYGVERRDTPTIVSNALWLVMEVIILVGAARFNSRWL